MNRTRKPSIANQKISMVKTDRLAPKQSSTEPKAHCNNLYAATAMTQAIPSSTAVEQKQRTTKRPFEPTKPGNNHSNSTNTTATNNRGTMRHSYLRKPSHRIGERDSQL